jgi:hypothetical protein
MTVSDVVFISGVAVTFSQVASMIDYFVSKSQDSQCSKYRKSCVNLLKYDMKDILQNYRDNRDSKISEAGLHAVNDAYWDFMSALESDVETLGLCFKASKHDVYKDVDIAGIVGLSVTSLALSKHNCNMSSVFKVDTIDCRDLLSLKLGILFDTDTTQELIFDTYSVWGVGDDCGCS